MEAAVVLNTGSVIFRAAPVGAAFFYFLTWRVPMPKLLVAISVIVISCILIWRITRRRSQSASESDVYVCPTCGAQHCDCYKKSK